MKFNKPMKVGKNFWKSRSSKIFSQKDSSLIIGDDVFIAGEVIIMNHFHDLSLKGNIKNESPSHLEIGNNVFIGYGAMILPQVHRIGNNVVVGAGSFLIDDIPDNEIWAGNPAKKIGMRV